MKEKILQLIEKSIETAKIKKTSINDSLRKSFYSGVSSGLHELRTDILSLKDEQPLNNQNDFIKGFVAACAITLKNHGCDTIVEDTYRCKFYTINQLEEMGVDDYDIELLKPIIKEIERKNRL